MVASLPAARAAGHRAALRRGTPAPLQPRLQRRPSPEREPVAGRGRGPRIVCAACRAPVTSAGARIAVGGSHRHRFFNPHGILFHIGCFRTAPGCRVSGVPTFEFTWFPGHAWRYASCGRCAAHLGWRFDAPSGGGFFGLILDRLREEADEPGEGGHGR